MINELSDKVQQTFDSIRRLDKDKKEFWYARELSDILGYVQWRNFENNVSKAMRSIANTGESVEKHFANVSKMVETGNNTMRDIGDIKLSRYACYIIAMNGDPTKVEIAMAQTYFAQQTRRQELRELEDSDQKRIDARQKLTESDKYLSGVAMSRGVNGQQLAQIKSEGDKRLFGGNDTRAMKQKYNVNSTKPLADYLPTISLTAKQLANEMTAVNSEEKDLQGFGKIGREHIDNNLSVRKSLLDRGIKPEDLPPEEDIKKVERRVKPGYTKKLK